MRAIAVTVLSPAVLLSSLFWCGSSGLAFPAPQSLPGFTRRDTTCIADSCLAWQNELGYCWDLFSGPVYGAYGSSVAQAEAPASYSCPSGIRTCSINQEDINCVCGPTGSGPTGIAAAQSCYFCEIEDNPTQYTADYTQLVVDWVVTCDTWKRVSPAAAVSCWNSNFQDDCWTSDSK